MHNKISGEYKLVITSLDGTKRETEWFSNMVLNQGLNHIGDGGNNFGYCRLGSGTLTPAETQTALVSQIACSNNGNSVASSFVNAGPPTYTAQFTFSWTFSQGAVIGNISEIGVGWGTTGNTLFSRALITDTYGNPITITLVAMDQLTVYYKLNIVPNLDPAYGSFYINGVGYGYSSQIKYAASFGSSVWGVYSQTLFAPMGWTCYNASPLPTLSAITANGPTGVATSNWTPLSNGTSQGNCYNLPYITDSFYVDSIWYFTIYQGNGVGGLGGLALTYGSYPYGPWQYQIVFDRPIPKNATNTLSLTTRISWSR